MTRYGHQEQKSAQHSELGSLDDVRSALAADVALLARAVPLRMPHGSSETRPVEQSDVPSEDRQALLRAAIADLNVMYVVLHEDRR